ncbi:MAG: amino acid adenylation domain-containing protein, partial [Crocinitomix sp.]|nr:amino acid adenylation domain-containing protein [Crocinitomix sp.]
GFDLEGASQMRLHVLDLADGSFEFIWSFHHILMDGWCMSILTNEFYQLLNSAAQGEEANLPEVANYSNYIQWLDTVDKEETKKYWAGLLEEYSTAIQLPFEEIKTPNNEYINAKETILISEEQFKSVEELCGQLGITQNSFVQGVWGFLLSKYNSTSDVVFGAVVSGRPSELEGVEQMVGLFINTVPVRVKYTQESTVQNFLKTIQDQSIKGGSNHYLSLSDVNEQSELGKDLLNHILVFENYPISEIAEQTINGEEESIDSLTIESLEMVEQTNYDFSVMIAPSDVDLKVELRYNAAKYSEVSIQNVATQFERLVQEFSEKSTEKLTELEFLSKDEIDFQLDELAGFKSQLEGPNTLIQVFEKQVANHPDNAAVVFKDKMLTYAELDEISSQMAYFLSKEKALSVGEFVGIKIERSEWFIVSVLAILKLRAAYVPIDPTYPKERIDFIEKDSGCRIVVTAEIINEFIAYSDKQLVSLSKDSYDPNDLAYVIYTSGSTGQPKGVMIENKGITNTIKAQIEVFGVTPTSKALFFSSFSFDASVSEVFTVLLKGACLYILEEELRTDIKGLKDYVNNNEIEIAFFPPAIVRMIDIKSLNIQVLITGGETADVRKAKEFLTKGSFINAYGPAETSICATMNRLECGTEVEVTNIPIGNPICNATCYILGSNNELLPKGAIGEICVGGNGLAKGYLNRPDLTAEKFIAHPFIESERLYKTGDLGRWLPGGMLDFVGRADDQVKIRGHRVEIGEIENTLLSKPDLQEIVILAEATDHGKELVCYLVSEKKQTAEELRTYLSDRLPDYMIPSGFVQLDQFPLTTNGKVDKRALKLAEGEVLSGGQAYVAANTAKEALLVDVWEAVLKRSPISITDSFYNLGGDSIKSIQIVSRLKQHGFSLKIEHILRTPVLSDLAKLVEKNERIIDQSVVEGDVLLTPIQTAFFKDASIQTPSHYNQSILLKAKSNLDGEALEAAISHLVNHHDALRMVYRTAYEQIVQYNNDITANNYTYAYHDLRESSDELAEMGTLGEVVQS